MWVLQVILLASYTLYFHPSTSVLLKFWHGEANFTTIFTIKFATWMQLAGNQDKEQPIYIDLTRQPIYIDLTRPDLIDLTNCVNNVCHSSCDFCNFRHQPICDCNPPVVVDLTQADLNNLREYHQALRQTSIQDYLTLKDSAPLN